MLFGSVPRVKFHSRNLESNMTIYSLQINLEWNFAWYFKWQQKFLSDSQIIGIFILLWSSFQEDELSSSFRILRCGLCSFERSIRDNNERRDENHASPNSAVFLQAKNIPERKWSTDSLWLLSELEMLGRWWAIFRRSYHFVMSRITFGYISPYLSQHIFHCINI